MSVPLAFWVEQFLLPLYARSSVHVRASIDAAAHERGLHALAPEVHAQLQHERTLAAALVGLPAIAPMTAAEWSLACAVNNLLFAAHPQGGRGARRGKLLELTQTFLPKLPPRGASETIGRHLVVRALASLDRHDARVRFWAGEQTYFGQTPPPRLQLFPELRRVRTESWRTPIWQELTARADSQPLAAALLACSPLTTWLDPIADIELALRPILFCLADRQVARIVVDHLLRLELADRAARVGGAMMRLCADETATPSELRLALSLVVHLQLLEAIAPPAVANAFHDEPERDFRALYLAAAAVGIVGPAVAEAHRFAARARIVAGESRIARFTALLVARLGAAGAAATVVS